MTKKMKFGIVSLVPLGNSVAIGCKEPVIHFWDANVRPFPLLLPPPPADLYRRMPGTR